MTERIITIATTREKVDALRRFLEHQFLGHTKDEELVRAFLADVEAARKPTT